MMELPRRRFLAMAAGAAAASASPGPVHAEAYPTRPVRLVCGFGAGSATDIVARLVGDALSERLGQAFVIENRPGAGSNVATEYVVRSAPDGYTLLQITPPHAINATLYSTLNYNFLRDIAPIASVGENALVMVVNPNFPARTVAEFIAYAKANPGKINFASAGIGTGLHVSGELFKMMTGIQMTHVPYRSDAPAIADLIAGQVQVMFDPIVACIEQVRSGTLRALAVTTAERARALPDVPTVAETVPGYEARGFQGVGAPHGTPTEIIDLLNKTINSSLVDPKLQGRLAAIGNEPLILSPDGFAKLLAEETEKWGKVVKFAGLKAD
jgi:tripartite-type tricarboxylate transporter receptor subunit TctC